MTEPDHGAPAAARRGVRASIAIAAALAGFVMALAWAGQVSRTRASEDRRAELARIAAARQGRAAALERELAGLRERADRLASARATGPIRAIQSDLDRLGLLAGTTAARGGGLVVTLSDSPLAEEDPSASADFRIQDIDLQLVANELWNAGAEAIAINGQRIVGTTAIRTAGEAILVNFKVLSSPYRIEAIGPSKTLRALFEASEVAKRFLKWTDLYRLGYAVASEDALRLPAYTGTLRFEYARAAQD